MEHFTLQQLNGQSRQAAGDHLEFLRVRFHTITENLNVLVFFAAEGASAGQVAASGR